MRDQFVASSLRSPMTTMPRDKQFSNNASAKPLTPALSGAFKTSKAPLTPKLAGSTPSTALRRPAPLHSTPEASPRIDASTPGSTLLNANITPRSGSRISRRDGLSPSASTPPSMYQRPLANANAVNTSPLVELHSNVDNNGPAHGRVARVKSVGSESAKYSGSYTTSSNSSSTTGTSMFFHASEAKPHASLSEQEPLQPAPHVKPAAQSAFLYAGSRTAQQTPRTDSRSVVSLSRNPGQGNRSPQLRSPDVAAASPRLHPPSHASYLSNDVNVHGGQRPLSSQSFHDPRSNGNHEPHASRHRLSSSTDNSKRPSHRKTSSVDASHLVKTSPQSLLASPITSPALVTSDHCGPAGFTSPELSPMVLSNRTSASVEHPPCPSCLHNQISEDPHQKMNDLAANARRERKVLDLEISNSSLLAINRTLEREMRKQNAELRRFRRLSRTGRLSINESFRSVSGGQLSIVSETGDGVSELSTVNSDGELSDSSDEQFSSTDSGASSPGSNAEPRTERSASRRRRDERRFLLDLSKHQQLLVDSQKLNESIKRCLGRTESLILEGKKALEYNVRVSDVDIGGRVLNPDELDELDGDKQGGRGLLSPSTEITSFTEIYNENSSLDLDFDFDDHE
ncbi:hypothetical protein AJ80_08879 [Polytolypa hystricis UAMH7299]|uniref:Uncharacterized protein n=1 Tax=Polytolypa hystricis (strain UAMH7299) TaxID=1447883 RepID=A0A2B7WS89_POLH7|nr:hypothetical protein AJ80_08879 [Polytolypa hystricis UAMH7299]